MFILQTSLHAKQNGKDIYRDIPWAMKHCQVQIKQNIFVTGSKISCSFIRISSKFKARFHCIATWQYVAFGYRRRYKDSGKLKKKMPLFTLLITVVAQKILGVQWALCWTKTEAL